MNLYDLLENYFVDSEDTVTACPVMWDTLYEHTHLCTDILSNSPVNSNIGAHPCYCSQGIITQYLNRTVIWRREHLVLFFLPIDHTLKMTFIAKAVISERNVPFKMSCISC